MIPEEEKNFIKVENFRHVTFNAISRLDKKKLNKKKKKVRSDEEE